MKPESIQTDEEELLYSLDGKLLGRGKDALRRVPKGQTVILKTGSKRVKMKINYSK